jgi:heparan-alpha-glucosaminide N-acetyltransferase
MDDREPRPLPPRLASVDAYRGFVMFLMMAEVLRLGAVARAIPDSPFWKALAHHQSHVEWVGASLHDLIQPSFSFLVGVALPFSVAARLARGQSRAVMTAHACWRALVLVALGVFLRSVGHPQTRFTFEDTLSQIGLGYPFLFVLAFRPQRDRWAAMVAILVGYWALFAVYSPGTGFDPTRVGVPAGWPHHPTGFAAHWDKNANPAWAFDVWFLNLFPRESPFTHNGGGYATLSFIPTLGTMVLGLICGDVLRSDRPASGKIAWMTLAGLAGLAGGEALGALGVCPVVKRIWTPSWVLFSGGWCFLLTAAWYAVLDVAGLRRWAFPLVVVGMNSIAAYCLSHLIEDFIASSLKTHLGPGVFDALGPAYRPLLAGGAVLLVLWLILFWMYRRRIFLRV